MFFSQVRKWQWIVGNSLKPYTPGCQMSELVSDQIMIEWKCFEINFVGSTQPILQYGNLFKYLSIFWHTLFYDLKINTVQNYPAGDFVFIRVYWLIFLSYRANIILHIYIFQFEWNMALLELLVWKGFSRISNVLKLDHLVVLV